MIPVPQSELQLYDIENETDFAYKDLVQNEMIFIRKNHKKIFANAQLLYKQKIENDLSAGYVKTALEYKTLEELGVLQTISSYLRTETIQTEYQSLKLLCFRDFCYLQTL